MLLVVLALLAAVHSTPAQNPVITSFRGNGVLVCSNLNPGSAAAVEWASSAAGPWQSDWTSLSAVPVPSNRTVQVSVPMFYRARGVTGTNFAPAGMALIPAGLFTIGDTLGDAFNDQQDAVPTNVSVSAFYIDLYPVTYTLWQTVATYALSHGYSFVVSGAGKAANHPVEGILWSDCVKWCNARSQQAGLTPVYYTDSALTSIYTNAPYVAVYANWTNTGYRLPTEAEWEKAARGGVRGQRFPSGNTISRSDANYDSSTGLQTSFRTYDLAPGAGWDPAFATGAQPYTSPVGTFAPNGYGLYDTSGNVFQWCWDWYAGKPYPAGSAYSGGNDPRGPASGNTKVARGGSFNSYPYDVRCATRFAYSTNYATLTLGFRCARRP